MNGIRVYVLALAVAAVAFFGAPACAQGWTDKTVRIVVTVAPGGPIDFVARLAAEQLAAATKQTVVVENKPGGGGSLAFKEVYRAEPDGTTLLWADPSMVITPTLMPDAQVDIGAMFRPVSLFAVAPSVFAVHPDLPVKNVAEFLAYAKANPGKLHYGAGQASGPHLQGELLKQKTGIDATFVPYRGGGPAVQDLLAGRLQFMLAGATTLLPSVRAGTLRLLATTGDTRLEIADEVPTMVEAGVPGYVVSQWFGFAVHAKTPDSIVDRLNSVVRDIANNTSVQNSLKTQGAVMRFSTSKQFAEFIAQEAVMYRQVIEKIPR